MAEYFLNCKRFFFNPVYPPIKFVSNVVTETELNQTACTSRGIWVKKVCFKTRQVS